MKTSAKKVTVAILVDGKSDTLEFPIVTGNGELMTHRLKRLMTGTIGDSRKFIDKQVHFVGMVWRPPYGILQEVANDRTELQEKLRGLGGPEKLVGRPRIEVPTKSSNGQVTTLLQQELALRGQLKAEIARLTFLQEKQAARTEATSEPTEDPPEETKPTEDPPEVGAASEPTEGGGWISP